MDLVIPGRLVILLGSEFAGGAEDSLKRTILVPDVALGSLIVEKVVISQAKGSASDRGLDVGLQHALVAGKWRRKREVDLDHTGYDGCASAVHGQAAVQIKLAQHRLGIVENIIQGNVYESGAARQVDKTCRRTRGV